MLATLIRVPGIDPMMGQIKAALLSKVIDSEAENAINLE